MRNAASLLLAAVAASMALVAGVVVFAAEPDGDRQQAACDAQGGCVLVTAVWLRTQLMRAFNDGFGAGKESAKCAAPTT